MNEELETLDDIAAELRERAWKWTKDPELAKALETYADRIETAAKRQWDLAYTEGFDDRSCN